MPFQSIEPRRLYRQIADQIRGLIRSGEFQAGARLPPGTIAPAVTPTVCVGDGWIGVPRYAQGFRSSTSSTRSYGSLAASLRRRTSDSLSASNRHVHRELAG